jgi:hypothetical protein
MEKRESARLPVALPVSFSGEGIAGGGLVSELSDRGCKITSDDLLLPGTTLALHIQLPAQSTPLKVDLAEVRWAEGQECGLEFVRLPLQDKQRLQQFLDALQRAHGGGSR